MSKESLRKDTINKRNILAEEIKKQYDGLIFEALVNTDIYKEAEKIFIYISFGSEVDTKEIIKHSLANNKEIYVPKTDKNNKEMVAVKIHSLNTLIVDKWGILEPKDVDKDKISNDFDLIIMPGVVFDKQGNRIGYGAGYYDKYICKQNLNTTMLALAYEMQIIENINSEAHDVKVDYILSEKELRKIQKKYLHLMDVVYNKNNK